MPTASSTPRSSAIALPVHQSLTHPLNEKALLALRSLPRNHKLDSLKERLQLANSRLQQTATDINDQLYERQNGRGSRKRAREEDMPENGTPEDGMDLATMKKDTENMTNELEAGVRKVVDAGEEVHWVEAVVKDLNTSIASGRVPPATQTTLGDSQHRSSQRQRTQGDAVSEDTNENDQSESQTVAEKPPSALEALNQSITREREAYAKKTQTDRYANHDDYVGFRKMVHDAINPEENAKPLPHSSTWFADGPSSTQSFQNGGVPGSQALDEDEDIEITTERIDVKCPITLVQMKEPVSSTKCPHNYERSAILDMISRSEETVEGTQVGRGNRARRAMRCPVPGCDVRISADDLKTDPVLIRKIKRKQAALRAQDEEADDDLTRSAARSHGDRLRRAETVGSSPAPSMPARLKAERMSQRPGSMVPDTQFDDEADNDNDASMEM